MTSAATAWAPRFTVVGITDEHNTCDCCGRNNLRRAVGLRPNDGGEIVFYGTTCAAYAMLGRKLDRTRSENYIAEQVGIRSTWRQEADRIAKVMADHGTRNRDDVTAEYNRRNRSPWGKAYTPDVIWTNGSRWFGWVSTHATFDERLGELGWTKELAPIPA